MQKVIFKRWDDGTFSVMLGFNKKKIENVTLDTIKKYTAKKYLHNGEDLFYHSKRKEFYYKNEILKAIDTLMITPDPLAEIRLFLDLRETCSVYLYPSLNFMYSYNDVRIMEEDAVIYTVQQYIR